MERGTEFEARALSINGKSAALIGLREWTRSSPKEWLQLRQGLRMICNLPRHDAIRLKRVSPDRQGRGVYELCNRGGGNGRVFFFYPGGLDTLVILTNTFWKGSRNQEAAFDEAAELKKLFEEAREWGG